MAFSRWVAFSAGTIANAILGIVYVRVILPMIQMGTSQFASGPVSFDALSTVIPAAIGIIQLGLIVWVLASPVTREKAAARGRV